MISEECGGKGACSLGVCAAGFPCGFSSGKAHLLHLEQRYLWGDSHCPGMSHSQDSGKWSGKDSCMEGWEIRLLSCLFLGGVKGGGRRRQFLHPCSSFEFTLGQIYHWFSILTPHWIRVTSYPLFWHQEQTGSDTSGYLYLLEEKQWKRAQTQMDCLKIAASPPSSVMSLYLEDTHWL